MAEYIEREALQKAVAGIHFDAVFARDFGKTFFYKVLNQYRDAVFEAIKKAPAADVVEGVRSGLYEALKDIIWYDGHAEWLIKLRDDIEKAQKEGAQAYGNPFEVEEWHTEKHTIWMLLVGMFGDWGTSIRGGWIDNFDGCINFINAVIADEEGEADAPQ